MENTILDIFLCQIKFTTQLHYNKLYGKIAQNSPEWAEPTPPQLDGIPHREKPKPLSLIGRIRYFSSLSATVNDNFRWADSSSEEYSGDFSTHIFKPKIDSLANFYYILRKCYI